MKKFLHLLALLSIVPATMAHETDQAKNDLDILLIDGADEEDIYRVRPYGTPAVFYGPVSIDDPQGNPAFSVDGSSVFSTITSNDITAVSELILTYTAAYVGSPLVVGPAGLVVVGTGGGSSSPGIITIDGDTGSVTGSVVAFHAQPQAGGTVLFSPSSATVMDLIVTDVYGNTAIGKDAGINLTSLTTNNTAIGTNALGVAISGTDNTAVGVGTAGNLTIGGNNIAIGYDPYAGSAAGATWGTAQNNIAIANTGAAENNTIRLGNGFHDKCFIAGIYNITSSGGTEVYCSSSGQLGTLQSSHKYKNDIIPLPDQSSALMQLEPVQFIYKNDDAKIKQCGLIAEDVYNIYPELVVFDQRGEIQTVRYNQLHALLLKGWQEQQNKIEELCKRLAVLEAAAA